MISSRALSAVQIELLFHYHGEAVDRLGNPGGGRGRRLEGGDKDGGGRGGKKGVVGRKEEGEGREGGVEIKAKFGKLS